MSETHSTARDRRILLAAAVLAASACSPRAPGSTVQPESELRARPAATAEAKPALAPTTAAPTAADIPCGAVSCGDGQACCWNSDRQQGRCAVADSCDLQASEATLSCGSPADCPDGECCQSPLGTLSCQPRGTCVQSMGATLCNQVTDCGLIAASIKAQSCSERPKYPPGMKFCSYP